MTGKKNIEFISILRAIAPLLVLWAHLAGWWLMGVSETWDVFSLFHQWIAVPLNLYQNGGLLGVALFFIISGFIISYTAESETRRTFAIKRIFRIWPGLCVAIIAMAIAKTSVAHFDLVPIVGHEKSLSILDYAKNIFFAHWLDYPHSPPALSITWSLVPEVVFYAMVVFTIPWLNTRPAGTTVGLLAASVALNAASLIDTPTLGWTKTLLGLPLFVLGRSLYLVWSRKITVAKGCALAAASVFALAALQIILKNGQYAKDVFSSYALAVGLFVALMLANPQRPVKVVRFFSDISYALYLLHMSAGVFVANVLYAQGLSTGVCIVAGGVASIVIAWSVTVLIDRPSQALGRRILNQQTNTLPADKNRLVSGSTTT